MADVQITRGPIDISTVMMEHGRYYAFLLILGRVVIMKKGFFCAVVLGVGSLVLPGSAWAHHGDAGRYTEEVVTLTGTLVQLVLVSPHAMILLDVTENGTTTRWTAELGGPQQLGKQFGWTPAATKAWIGNKVTLIGRRVKSGGPYMNLTERANIVLTDTGKEIFRTANFGQPAPPPTEQK